MQETWETWVWSLDREDPLEEEMATNSSILAWRIIWTEDPGGLHFIWLHFSWDQFIHLVVSLQPHRLQHANLSVHGQLLEFTQTHFYWVSNVIQPSHPVPLLLLPPIPPSTRVFSNELTLCMRWPKYWSFSFNISPASEYSGLISLGWTGWISLLSKRLSRVFSNTTVQKQQFFDNQLSL